jgi:hypothetical protein
VLPDRDSAFAVRSVPVRIYLPDGPVLQELAPPLRDDGAFSPDNSRIHAPNGRCRVAGDHVTLLACTPPPSVRPARGGA